MSKPIKAYRSRGASLLVSLLLLIVIAMIGMAVGNVSVLEEHMAGGSRDRDLSLQAAEAALRDAEESLKDVTFRTTTAFPAFVATNANTAAFWETCFTGTTAPCAVKYTPTAGLPTTGSGALAEQPRYIIEEKPSTGPGGTTKHYRVTARSVGGTVDAVVVLQAEFTYTPDP